MSDSSVPSNNKESKSEHKWRRTQPKRAKSQRPQRSLTMHERFSGEKTPVQEYTGLRIICLAEAWELAQTADVYVLVKFIEDVLDHAWTRGSSKPRLLQTISSLLLNYQFAFDLLRAAQCLVPGAAYYEDEPAVLDEYMDLCAEREANNIHLFRFVPILRQVDQSLLAFAAENAPSATEDVLVCRPTVSPSVAFNLPWLPNMQCRVDRPGDDVGLVCDIERLYISGMTIEECERKCGPLMVYQHWLTVTVPEQSINCVVSNTAAELRISGNIRFTLSMGRRQPCLLFSDLSHCNVVDDDGLLPADAEYQCAFSADSECDTALFAFILNWSTNLSLQEACGPSLLPPLIGLVSQYCSPF